MTSPPLFALSLTRCRLTTSVCPLSHQVSSHRLCLPSLSPGVVSPPLFALSLTRCRLTTSVCPLSHQVSSHHLCLPSLSPGVVSPPLFVLSLTRCRLTTSVCPLSHQVSSHHLCLPSLSPGELHQRPDAGIPVLRAVVPRGATRGDPDHRAGDPRPPGRALHGDPEEPSCIPHHLLCQLLRLGDDDAVAAASAAGV